MLQGKKNTCRTKSNTKALLEISLLKTVITTLLIEKPERKKASNRNVNLMNQKPLKISRTPY